MKIITMLQRGTMNIYVSKFISENKIESLTNYQKDFNDFGFELFFAEWKITIDDINHFDVFFMDYEQSKNSNFIEEYEMILSENKKFVFLTDILSPFKEFEMTTMLNTNAESMYKEIKRVFNKYGDRKIKYSFADKRWKYQDIENLKYLKKSVKIENWHIGQLDFLNAKQGDFFTNAQYVTMQKLIELYIFDYKYVTFPLKYMPKYVKNITYDDVEIEAIDLLNIYFDERKNEFLESIINTLSLEDFSTIAQSFFNNSSKVLYIGDELYFYDALLNYFKYLDSGVYFPNRYLPRDNFINGTYKKNHIEMRIYTIGYSIEDSTKFYEPSCYTQNDVLAITQILKKIDLNNINNLIYQMFEDVNEEDRYTEEEYLIYLELKKIVFDHSSGIFIPQKYIKQDSIIFDNKTIHILPIEEYTSSSTQRNKLYLLNKERQNNFSIKEPTASNSSSDKNINIKFTETSIIDHTKTENVVINTPILNFNRKIIYDVCYGESDIYILCETISFNALYHLSQYLYKDSVKRQAFIVIDSNKNEQERFCKYMNNDFEGEKSSELNYSIKAYAIEQALKAHDIVIYDKNNIGQGLLASNHSIFGFKHFGTYKAQQIYLDNRISAAEHNKDFIMKQIDLSAENYDLELNNAALFHKYNTEEIFYLMLMNIFKEDVLKKTREDVKKSSLPESKIWNQLYEFQKDGVYALIHRIEKYNGAILADDVGLGKTYQALAVAKYYNSFGKKVLVIAPKKLYDNWYRELAVNNNATFKDDGFDYSILYHTTLTSKNLPNGGAVADFNFNMFDLVIVDEAHAFRNSGTTRYKKLKELFNKSKKVLFLTATPVNNSIYDLDNLIKLCTNFNDKILADEGIKSIELVLKQAQRNLEYNIAFPTDFFKIVDSFIVTRDKKYIKNNYFSLINFPSKKVNNINAYGNNAFIIDELYEKILELSLVAYSPSQFFEKFDNVIQREVSIKNLILNLLFKRFESSYESFASTLINIRTKFENIVNNKLKYDQKTLKLVNTDESESYLEFENMDEMDIDDFELLSSTQGSYTEMTKRTPLKLKDKIREDILVIDSILSDQRFKSEGRTKFTTLEEEVNKLLSDEKILIFTTYSDTAIEIYETLKRKFSYKGVGLVTGQTSIYTSRRRNEIKMGNKYDDILKSFSPRSKGVNIEYNKTIDILIATDVISEGQNLQDCSNILHFDIHWNPVRMIQRIGRIDRIGSEHNVINNKIFWPTESVNKYIELVQKIDMKFKAIEATGGATIENDAQFNTEKEQIKSISNGNDLNTSDFVEKLQNATNDYYPYMHDYKIMDNEIDKYMKVKKSKEILSQLRGIFSVVKSDIYQITALISIDNKKLLVCQINENGEIVEKESLELLNEIKKNISTDNSMYLEKEEVLYYKSFFERGILEIAKINKTSTQNIQFICGVVEIEL